MDCLGGDSGSNVLASITRASGSVGSVLNYVGFRFSVSVLCFSVGLRALGRYKAWKEFSKTLRVGALFQCRLESIGPIQGVEGVLKSIGLPQCVFGV